MELDSTVGRIILPPLLSLSPLGERERARGLLLRMKSLVSLKTPWWGWVCSLPAIRDRSVPFFSLLLLLLLLHLESLVLSSLHLRCLLRSA